jgi:2-methylisocitrate lyase-like PEP mutase family enzyme
MKGSRFSEEQIIGILREQEAEASTADVCRKHGISSAISYKWKTKFGDMVIEFESPWDANGHETAQRGGHLGTSSMMVPSQPASQLDSTVRQAILLRISREESMSDNSSTVAPSRRAFFAAAGTAVATVATSSVTAAQPQAVKSTTMGDRLRALIAQPGGIVAPICYDVASAKLAQHMGFKLITVGGSSVSSGMYGMGDFGMVTVSELIEFATRVAASLDVPLLADGDDCGGNPMNTYRAIQRYARAGVASVLLEDMTGAKHVPGRPEGTILPKEQQVDKIKAAVEAAGEGGPLILARCDAMARKEPFEQALDRAEAYCDAGAELIFVSGATPEQHQKVAEITGKAVFTVGGGKNTAEALFAHKVKIANFFVEPYALGAAHQALMTLLKEGSTNSVTLPSLPRDISAAITDTPHWVEISRKFNAQQP